MQKLIAAMIIAAASLGLSAWVLSNAAQVQPPDPPEVTDNHVDENGENDQASAGDEADPAEADPQPQAADEPADAEPESLTEADPDTEADADDLSEEAFDALISRGQGMYFQRCVQCHQIHGGGQRGMGPPLVDSDYVLGSPERLAAIILDGVVDLSDEHQWTMQMPATREDPIMDDERLAALVTFLRNNWTHDASPLTPERAAEVRQATESRDAPWTKDDLENIELD